MCIILCYNLNKMELGQKIKELREKKNLRQEDLGLAVGAKQPRGWGSQIENGIIQNLKMKHAISLAKLLDVDPTYFYNDNGETSNPQKTSERLQVVEDPLLDFKKLAKDPLREKKSKSQIIILLTEENRLLIRENAYLKSLLLKHKIEVYNADTQNDTV